MGTSWEQALNEYFAKWNEGFINFEPAPIKDFYHDEFIGFWGNSQLTVPEQYSKDYDLEVVLRSMPGAVKKFNTLHYSERGENEIAIIGIEIALFEGNHYPAQTMYIWRNTENGWKIMREYIELER